MSNTSQQQQQLEDAVAADFNRAAAGPKVYTAQDALRDDLEPETSAQKPDKKSSMRKGINLGLLIIAVTALVIASVALILVFFPVTLVSVAIAITVAQVAFGVSVLSGMAKLVTYLFKSKASKSQVAHGAQHVPSAAIFTQDGHQNDCTASDATPYPGYVGNDIKIDTAPNCDLDGPYDNNPFETPADDMGYLHEDRDGDDPNHNKTLNK